MSKQYEFILVGDSPNIIEIAEILENRNHTIACIVTLNFKLKVACVNKGWKVFDDFRRVDSCDIILSVSNSLILTEEDLSKARQFSLNCHDSILPSYRGVNAVPWAILNNETQIGISWHYIEKKIDSGSIVFQEKMNLSWKETVEEVSLRIAELITSSFDRLLTNIEYSKLDQPLEILDQQGSYYPRKKIPEDLGIINNRKKNLSEVLNCLRAYSSGEYSFEFVLPKIFVDGRLYLVRDFDVVESDIKESFSDILLKDLVCVKDKSVVLENALLSNLSSDDYMSKEILNDCHQKIVETTQLANLLLKNYYFTSHKLPKAQAINFQEYFIDDGDLLKVAYFFCIKLFQKYGSIPIHLVTDDSLYDYKNSCGLLDYYIPIVIMKDAIISFDCFKGVVKSVDKRRILSEKRSFTEKSCIPLSIFASNSEYFYIADSPIKLISSDDSSSIRVMISEEYVFDLISDCNDIQEQIDYVSSQGSNYDSSIKQPSDSLVCSDILNALKVYANQIAFNNNAGREFSYSSLEKILWTRANFFKSKFGKQSVIAVLCKPGVDYLIDALSIMLSGNIYLPLDPKLPASRVEYILQNSKASAFITSRELYSPFKEGSLLPSVVFQNELAEIDNNESRGSFSVEDILPNDLAYIIYTSGTTGNPKGVSISHRNLTNYISHCRQNYLMQKNTVVFHSSPAFDMSITSFVFPITQGKRVSVISSTDDIDSFEEALYSDDIALLKVTPTHLRLMSNMIDTETVKPFIECLIVGGEKLKLIDVDNIKNKIKFKYLFNEYGPTENTVGCIVHRLCYDEKCSKEVPIGRDIDRTYSYIVDKSFTLVGNGEVGELILGGESLSPGYIGNTQLNDKKFITNPFLPEETVYRTGDLVFRSPQDGLLYFIGRSDEQIKYKGYRIEPSEIETACYEIKAINGAYASIVNYNNSEQLVLFISLLKNEEVVNEQELLLILKEKLPEYMIPKKVFIIDEIPLKVSGKVDAKKIQSIIESENNEHVVQREENSDVSVIFEVWKETLKVESLDDSGNFLKLGGDSISSVLMASKLRKLGYSIKFNDVFKYPVLGDFIKYLLSKKETTNLEKTKKLDKVPLALENPVFSLTPVQQFFASNTQEEVKNFNMTISLKIKDSHYLEKANLKVCFEHALRAHEVFYVKFFKLGSRIMQKREEEFLCGGQPFYDELRFNEYIDETQLEEKVVQLQNKLSLFDGVMVGLLMVYIGEEIRKIIIISHHFLVDRVSWKIIVQQLEKLLVSGVSTNVFPNTKYSSWCKSLELYSNSSALIDRYNFWQVVSDKDEMFRVLSNNAKLTKFKFDVQFSRIKPWVNGNNVSIRDFLLLHFVQTISDIKSLNDVCVYLENHGRFEEFDKDIEVDLVDLVAFVANIYPLVFDTADISNEQDILKQVKFIRDLIESVPNQGIDFLVLLSKGYMSSIPSFEVLFNYLGEWDNKDDSLLSFESDTKFKNYKDFTKEYPKFTFNCELIDEKLIVEIVYDERYFTKQDIDNIQALFVSRISEVQALSDNKGDVKVVRNEFPLTPTQSGILYQILESDVYRDYYLIQTIIDISDYNPRLDFKKLESSVRDLVSKHLVLRTKFSLDQGKYSQVFLPYRKEDFKVKLYDLSTLEESSKVLNIQKYLGEQRLKGFDPLHYPLVKFVIMKLDDNKAKLIMTIPHIIYDGWCNNIILEDIKKFYYENLHKCEEDSTYLEYLNKFDSYSLTAKKFWEEYFSQREVEYMIPELSLGSLFQETDYNDSILIDYTSSQYFISPEYASSIFSINSKLYNRVTEFAQKNGFTFNSVVQSAWSLLLFMRSGFKPCIYGTSFFGRDLGIDSIEKVVGLFINTLPVAVVPSPNSLITEYIDQFQKDLFDIQGNSVGTLLSELIVNNKTKVSEIIKSIYTYQKSSSDRNSIENQGNAKLEKIIEKIGYDLVLTLFHSDDLKLRFNYRIKQFSSPIYIQKLFEEFCLVLGFITTVASEKKILDLKDIVKIINSSTIPNRCE